MSRPCDHETTNRYTYGAQCLSDQSTGSFNRAVTGPFWQLLGKTQNGHGARGSSAGHDTVTVTGMGRLLCGLGISPSHSQG